MSILSNVETPCKDQKIWLQRNPFPIWSRKAIFYDFLIIARVVTSQSQYYTFIVSKAWMILINETYSSEDFDDSFLIYSGYFNEPEYTEHEMNSLVYSDGSETSEEDEKDSSHLEIIHKICLQRNISTYCN